ncbi:hypothetical protein EW146_g10219 [Bondarzewia mesenterica]|uniref:Uncharacterized protein n=1 Tax=Bondarzewia mesenterica TaxID=1095465 RepID=A0A4S4L163_9AGAM|nr:hypothetical protein EW146_g10219 [Bondarzewia mesenterica]
MLPQIEPDDINPNRHAQLDRRSIQHLQFDDDSDWMDIGPQDALTDSVLPQLICAIARTSDKKVQGYRQLEQAQSLLDNNPALKEALRKAWSDQSFAKIRSAVLLRSPPSPPKTVKQRQRIERRKLTDRDIGK